MVTEASGESAHDDFAHDFAHDDEDLVRLMRRLTVESDRFAEMFGAANGVHRTDLNAVALIMDADRAGRRLSPGELGAALHLSASATTSLLDRLERAGHVHRDRDSADRRRIQLRVHDKALALGRRFFGPLGAELARVWAGFTDDQRATVAAFLAVSVEATVRTREGLVGQDDPG